MAFEPIIDSAALDPLLRALEDARVRLEALQIPPMLLKWLQGLSEARGAHMSTRIEGNPMSEPEVRELFARAPVRAERAELENLDYRDAARLAGQVADDPSADIDGGFVRSLHFVAVRNTDDYGSAGQYRQRQNTIQTPARVLLYVPPVQEAVSELMRGLVAWARVARRERVHPLVIASVAHAEFINIHPFDDGNGRTSRALTSYFAKRGGWGLRGLVRTEQVFGTDVNDYYSQLRRFGERYPGQHIDFSSWCRWFLRGLLRETLAAEMLVDAWHGVQEDLAKIDGPRLAEATHYVWLRGTVTSAEYAETMGVSHATAVNDLAKLIDAESVRKEGSGRSTRYATNLPPFEATALSPARLNASRVVGERFPEP